MKFIQGFDKNQTTLFPVTLEQSIAPDNEVRLIDLFVDSLPIDEYGFKTEFIENGRPAYHPVERPYNEVNINITSIITNRE